MKGKEFRDKVLELLIERKRTLKLEDIAEQAGTTVSWLKMFQQNKIEAPSVITMVNLYNALSDKKLKF